MEANNKSLRLNVLGLFTIEAPVQKMTVKQIILIMVLVMAFIVVMIIILKWYAIPTLGTPITINRICKGIAKIFKSRSP
jgi:hypothetical protein